MRSIAVGIHVLSQQHDLLVSMLFRSFHFAKHNVHIHTPFSSLRFTPSHYQYPCVGHDAVGAHVVTASHDGDLSGRKRLQERRRDRVVVVVSVEFGVEGLLAVL